MRIAAEIRRALLSDAEEISRVILRALHETNRQDYPAHVITAVAVNFSPERVAKKLAGRKSYVAIVDGAIVGSTSLDGRVIRSVYVDPTYQGKGIRTRLMVVLKSLARERAGLHSACHGRLRQRAFMASLALSSSAMNSTATNGRSS
jgi:GNAT superfamily N-acetyltransferase